MLGYIIQVTINWGQSNINLSGFLWHRALSSQAEGGFLMLGYQKSSAAFSLTTQLRVRVKFPTTSPNRINAAPPPYPQPANTAEHPGSDINHCLSQTSEISAELCLTMDRGLLWLLRQWVATLRMLCVSCAPSGYLKN
jgi:hypothetical protein